MIRWQQYGSCFLHSVAKAGATGTKYHFYGDFAKEFPTYAGRCWRIASGDKIKLELEGMEPVYLKG